MSFFFVHAAWARGAAACLVAAASTAAAQPGVADPARSAPDAIVQRTVGGHAMQYQLSLPRGWRADRSWPIVLVEESAEKDFRHAMQRYVDARGDLPFILVMPYSVILGSQGQRDPAVYPYSAQVWNSIDAQGACRFELEGVAHMLDEVRTAWHGEARVYATGLEAGAHLVWALALRQPETLAAAAPVAGNFRNRCVEDAEISHHPARTTLPIHQFIGAQDDTWLHGPLHGQFLDARRLAQAHGYARVGETVVPGHGHEAMAAEVLHWFASLPHPAP